MVTLKNLCYINNEDQGKTWQLPTVRTLNMSPYTVILEDAIIFTVSVIIISWYTMQYIINS